MPQSPLTYADQLRDAGDYAKSEAVLRAHLRRQSNDPGAHALLGLVLMLSGKRDQGEFMLRRAHALAPRDPQIAGMLGGTLVARGKYEDALKILEPVPVPTAGAEDALFNRALALVGLDRVAEAKPFYEMLMAQRPGNPSDACGLADVLYRMGGAREACRLLREALRLAPGNHQALSLLCMMSLNDDTLVDAQTSSHHLAAARAIADWQNAGVRVRTARELPWFAADPGKRLRIGFLSPDLRAHSVAYFFEPLLRELDRSRVEPYCYSCFGKGDEVTARLRAMVGEKHWRDVWKLSDDGIAAAIRADQLDVLVDLAGFTSHSRVDVMARRLAPLQLSAIGYPHAACFAAIDGWVVDSVTNPPGTAAMENAAEFPGFARPQALVRLDPCFLCYQPPADAPPAVPAPDRSGVRFGSFNSIVKWSPACIELWAGVLRAVPDSGLVLKSAVFAQPGVKERIAAAFAAHGIALERLTLLEFMRDKSHHLAAYGQIDVALDTYPYHGTTTTCEALFMGVPVVTLAGGVHAARVGVSLLTNAGMRELVAGTPEEFVRIAAGAAGRGLRAPEQRAGLRSAFVASPVCDARGYAAGWEATVRRAWAAVCERGSLA